MFGFCGPNQELQRTKSDAHISAYLISVSMMGKLSHASKTKLENKFKNKKSKAKQRKKREKKSLLTQRTSNVVAESVDSRRNALSNHSFSLGVDLSEEDIDLLLEKASVDTNER